MNISNVIYFDGESLKPDISTKIIYSGFLAKEEPAEIYMHYGYGNYWDNLQEVKLTKGPSGYENDVVFTEFGNIHFCFRSSNGTWDNNEGQNYLANIEKPEFDIPTSDSMALVEVPRLKKGYLIRKKIRITFYKVISFIGKLFTGKLLRHNS